MFSYHSTVDTNNKRKYHETSFSPNKPARLAGRKVEKRPRNCPQLSITKEDINRIFGPKQPVRSLREEMIIAVKEPKPQIDSDDANDENILLVSEKNTLIVLSDEEEEDPLLHPSLSAHIEEKDSPLELSDEKIELSDEEIEPLLMFEPEAESSESNENSLSESPITETQAVTSEKESSAQNFYLKRAYFDPSFSEEEKQTVRELALIHDALFDKKWLTHIHGRLRTLDADFAKNNYPSNVEVAYCESIKSQGLRATKQIRAGMLIGLYTGKVVRDTEYPKEQVYFFGICDGYSIDAADEGCHARYINHGGKDNNAAAYQFFLKDSDAPQIAVVSTKTIHKGEWIHLNYGDAYFESLEFTPSPLLPTDP